MKYKHLPRNKKLKSFSTKLRNEMTPEEKHLWYDFLRTYPIRFNRQRIIANYIVDFYCDQAKLAIELDGEQHYMEDSEKYDAVRTAALEKLVICVLRFSNFDIKRDFRAVCRTIEGKIAELLEA